MKKQLSLVLMLLLGSGIAFSQTKTTQPVRKQQLHWKNY